jgi:peptidoglycan/LPS O-acetylase OafA/YrhL
MSNDEPLHPLTSLRFFAAMGVVIFHSGQDVPFLAFGDSLWAMANGAVAFFFFLSGFILAHVYEPRPNTRARTFYGARIARIVPLYYLALVVSVLVLMRREVVLPIDVALNALLAQSWIPGHSQSLNSPGWSLSVELAFYLVFPFLLGRLRHRSSLWLASLAIGAWALNLAAHVAAVISLGGSTDHTDPWTDAVYYHPLAHVCTFVSGVAGGILFRRHRPFFARRAGLFATVGVAVVLASAYGAPGFVQRFHHNGLFAPAFYALIVGTGCLRGPVGALLSARPLQVLGEVSYGIYILQFPVIVVYELAMTRASVEVSRNVEFLAYVGVLCAVSVAAYYLVETPARRWIRKLFGA